MTEPHQQRRHFARIKFDTDYQLRVPSENTTWTGKLVDLSLHGALIKRPEDFDHSVGDKLELELRLSQDGIKIDMQAHIAHVHDDLLGLECEHIDVESMTHLRRILELNLGDPKLMEREIPEMLEVYKS